MNRQRKRSQEQWPAARPDRHERLEPVVWAAVALAGMAVLAGAAQWVWRWIFS